MQYYGNVGSKARGIRVSATNREKKCLYFLRDKGAMGNTKRHQER